MKFDKFNKLKSNILMQKMYEFLYLKKVLLKENRDFEENLRMKLKEIKDATVAIESVAKELGVKLIDPSRPAPRERQEPKPRQVALLDKDRKDAVRSLVLKIRQCLEKGEMETFWTLWNGDRINRPDVVEAKKYTVDYIVKEKQEYLELFTVLLKNEGSWFFEKGFERIVLLVPSTEKLKTDANCVALRVQADGQLAVESVIVEYPKVIVEK